MSINIYVHAGTHSKGMVRFGYKEVIVRESHWKPNKEDLKRAIQAQDFFLDFWYIKGGKPNREYVPPQNQDYDKLKKDVDYKLYDKDKKAEEQKKVDQMLINRLKKYLKVGVKYPLQKKSPKEPYDEYFTVKAMDDNEITWVTYAIKGFGHEDNIAGGKYTWEKFIECWVLKQPYRINGKTFENFFYNYGVNTRKKITSNRRKEDRKKEKEAEQPKEETKNVSIKKPVVKKEKPKAAKRNDIEVIDYSERAYALFGNTYDIRDKLKDIGATYNKWLKYGDTKKPGWILGKRKKEQLEEIIGQFD